MEEKRPCGFRNCKTLTIVEVNQKLENSGFYHSNWCNKCSKQYMKENKYLSTLVPKYNKMKLKNKFSGKIMKFKNGTDISNYLCRHNKRRELNALLKKA